MVESHEFASSSPQSQLSWIDCILHLVDRSRLPAPLWYVVGGLISIALFALNDWLALGQPWEGANPFHMVLALGPAYTLGLMHLLDFRAARALARMRPLLLTPEVYPELLRQLTTLPPRLTLLGSFGGMLVGAAAVVVERVALPPIYRPFLPAANARVFVEAWLIMSWFVWGALFIHTVHQLRQINRIYTHHVVIDLDNYQLLFHFSNVSAVTAIGLLVIPYGWSAAIPNLLTDPAGYSFGLFFPAFAVLAFLWPLIGVHNLMVEAKERALRENGAAVKAVRERLFHQIESPSLDGAGNLHDALEAVHLDRAALQRVPTWPWQPGTPRSVAAALALPLIVWFLQWVLQKVLGA